MPAVSIVIPAYNPGPFLGEALESIHRQSFDDWEVVVVDDGSREDLTWVSDRYPRVAVLRQENLGASVARNRGVLATTGPLISFMDQDDLWTPRKLQHQVDALVANPRAGACFCDLVVFSGAADLDEMVDAAASLGSRVPEIEAVLDPIAGPGEPSALALSISYFANAFVTPSTVMVRRECLAATGLLEPWMPFTGDFDLLIRLGAHRQVVRVHSVDVQYRKHSSNFSDDYDRGRHELRQMRAKYLGYASDHGDRHLARTASRALTRPRRMYAAQAFDRARYSWRQGDVRDTAHHLWRSACFHPVVLVEAVGHEAGSLAERAGLRTQDMGDAGPRVSE